MSKPIFEPEFWKQRLDTATSLHHSVFLCDIHRWARIEARHREILARHIGPRDSVIDCGCGYGRMLDLLPDGWIGPYLGVDLSPDLLLKAITTPHRHVGAFQQVDLRELSKKVKGYGHGSRAMFDWALLVSMRRMVIREAGQAEWDTIEGEIRRVARRLLYMEYDAEDEGSVE